MADGERCGRIMPQYTGQQAAWNGIKNSIESWLDLVEDRRETFLSYSPERQKEWLESGADPILEMAYLIHIDSLFSKTPKSSVKNPLDVPGNVQGKVQK